MMPEAMWSICNAHMSDAVVILDNGGGTIKLGLANSHLDPSKFPNASAKVKGERHTLLGDQILKHADLSSLSLRRPIDRGYVVNWDLEKLIWDRIFHACSIVPSSSALVVTEPPVNLPVLQQQMDQSCYTAVPAELAVHHWAAIRPDILSNQASTGLVVDCGFSFCHVLPVFDGRIVLDAVQRVNVGGKALTNYMKELASFRTINMMEETYLMEHVKDQTVFTSQDLKADLVKAKAGEYRLDYVLPDGVTSGTGHIRQPLDKEQRRAELASGKEVPALQLNNERFLVPELLFSPGNVDLNQAGLPEAIVNSVHKVHPDMRPLLLSNIICCGGLFRCPGLRSRLADDVRALVPAEYDVHLFCPADPSLTAWYGGRKIGISASYPALAISKAQYEEEGSSYMRSRRL